MLRISLRPQLFNYHAMRSSIYSCQSAYTNRTSAARRSVCCYRVRMLTDSRQLVLVFQLWAIISACVRAQIQQLLEPPYVISVGVRTENHIPFFCTSMTGFPVKKWALYRNGVRQSTTDPCTSSGKVSDDGVLTISPECDGFYSCGVNYTNNENKTGLVFSNSLPVYGEYLSLCLPFSDFITERAN